MREPRARVERRDGAPDRLAKRAPRSWRESMRDRDVKLPARRLATSGVTRRGTYARLRRAHPTVRACYVRVPDKHLSISRGIIGPMIRQPRRLASLLAATAVAAAAGLAIAQTAATRHKLHEELPLPSERPTPMIGSGSGTPAAFAAGDKVLPKPEVEAAPARSKGDEPVLGQGGFAADRQTSMKPDDSTGSDATLHYVSVFNPDVLPFKRMSALDGVADDYTLKVAHAALTDVPVGGATDKTRDRFWGSVLVQLAPGTDVALPSVAPDMRILSYEIKPPVPVRFAKDGADNFFVRTDESSARGTYRLVFLADADAGYFAPQLPTTRRYTARDVAEAAPRELRAALPPKVAAAARRTLDNLEIDATMELGTVFNKLVRHFRAFTAKPLPRSTGDLYRDLCDSQAGVCRHRAFAFMITANAVGIPTRFISNEAHAFVEVWFPSRGWQRLDLGGAALRMEVQGADNKTLHRPRADDPFAKPAEYKQSYTQLEGDIGGLTQQQIDDKQRSLAQAPASGAFGPDAGDGNGSAGGQSSNAPPPLVDRILPDQGLPVVPKNPKKQSPILSVTLADDHAFRGDQIHIQGQAQVNGKPLPGHAIDVFLSPAGRRGAGAIQIGRAATDATGTFNADFAVPPTIGLEAYEILLSSPEDPRYNAALSE